MTKIRKDIIVKSFGLVVLILLGIVFCFWREKNSSSNYLCLNRNQEFVLATTNCNNGKCTAQDRDGTGAVKLEANYDLAGGLYNNDLFDTAHSWCIKISQKDAQKFSTNLKLDTFKNSTTYKEYPFFSGDDRDLGFTYRALEKIRLSQSLLDNGAALFSDGEEMKYLQTTAEDQQRRVIEKRSAGNDIYELVSQHPHEFSETYSLLKNGVLLFEKPMEFGAEGPILDWRIVDGKAAFTYQVPNDNQTLKTEIFYDGEFLSQKYEVKNPRYLFSYQHKLGFIAADDEGDKIFFDDSIITPAFETIFTHNCCALTEILPIVYENGVLLFYGVRNNNQDYLVEVQLP